MKFGAELITTRDVVGLEVNGSARTVRFADGESIDAHTVILATGVSYRQLAAEGCDRLTGRGVFYGSALTEAANCKAQDVYIVGGANSAGQAAVYLARGARSVTLLVRGDSLTQSMSYYLIQQIEAIDNITVRTCTEVVEAHGDKQLERITLQRQEHRRARDRRRRLAVRVHRRRAAHRLAGRGRGARRARASSLAGPGPRRGRRAAGGMESGPSAVPPGDERARACSPPATCGPSRPSGSRPRSARARWP